MSQPIAMCILDLQFVKLLSYRIGVISGSGMNGTSLSVKPWHAHLGHECQNVGCHKGLHIDSCHSGQAWNREFFTYRIQMTDSKLEHYFGGPCAGILQQ